MKIEIISGSPRKTSVTIRVAIHLYNILSEIDEVAVGLIDVRDFILPPVETVINSPNDAPDELQSLATRIFDADAFILVTPEYNGGYSPAMKNLLDHFPKQQRKAFGIVTASPGALGGIRAALQVQHLVYGLMGIGSPQMLVVGEVEKKFDSKGELLDLKFSKQVYHFIDEFLWLADSLTPSLVLA